MRVYKSHNKTSFAATFMVIDTDICFSKGRKKEKGSSLKNFRNIIFQLCRKTNISFNDRKN